MKGSVAFLAFLLLIVHAPLARAHASPDPPEWMRRILHDYNDDWGGDDGQGLTRDGHDVMALDLQEAYNVSMGEEVLVLRLLMNFGYNSDTIRPELKEVVSFKANGQSVSKEFRTSDNRRFQGTFDAVVGPVAVVNSAGQPDGTRFYVEGVIKLSSLGLERGDALSDFFVQGYAGSERGDFMVGGYYVGGQRVDEPPSSEEADPASYNAGKHVLRGPVMYAQSNLDASEVSVSPGGNATLVWRIANPLGRTQTFALSNVAPSGIEIAFQGTHSSPGSLSLELGPGISTTVQVHVAPSATAESGPIELTLLTSLGGRNDHRVSVTVEATSSSAQTPGPSEAAKESPGATGLAVAIVLASALALNRGSRRGP